ncbi:hypothetical protein KIKIMORA_00040 [Brevundimonas phage vB_BpoS-Kikimora]|uniref:Uncharacterized protein n=1 Tax=Brevundimonas phage vB_BpoS-Kikimora TaxID=2948601 RepID=A0A9E7MQS2_9CAUD|nr:hypothetical protein KIKIMORA_00040 [Brevundimonas phage vB_BpoS-Kikimora]
MQPYTCTARIAIAPHVDRSVDEALYHHKLALTARLEEAGAYPLSYEVALTSTTRFAVFAATPKEADVKALAIAESLGLGAVVEITPERR